MPKSTNDTSLESLRTKMKRLAAGGEISLNNGATDAVTICRRLIKVQMLRMRQSLSSGAGGRIAARQRSSTIDSVLRYLWVEALDSMHGASLPASGIVALGGYGRGELCPHSDVDVMFVHEKCGPQAQKNFSKVVERVLYPLWDLGLKVGHSTRTIEDTIHEANSNLESKTSLIEARLLAGDSGLWEKLKNEFEEHCVKGREEEYFTWRLKDQANRHAAAGGSVFMKEPNIKRGCGGLRDYQNLIWIAYFWKRLTSTEELVRAGVLTRRDRGEMERAYDRLLAIRIALHFVCERAEDVLAFPLQGKVATVLGYDERPPIRRVEALMKDYYKAAGDIFLLANSVANRIAQSPVSRRRGFFDFLSSQKSKPQRELLEDGIILNDQKIELDSNCRLGNDPLKIIRLFVHAQERNATFGDELFRAVRAKSYLFTKRLVRSKPVRETLLSLLAKKGDVGRVMRLMHQTGVLGRVIPEFAPLTCLVQHDFYHLYSVDEHSLVCLEELDALLREGPLPGSQGRYRALMRQLEHPEWLYLATLLHDAGKATGRKHHEEQSALLVSQAAKRLRLPSAGARMVTFLADHHMTMNEVAVRRNIDDPDTVSDFARIVGDEARLTALMLISYADSRATSGEKGYSDWRDSMMWDLYERTLSHMRGTGSDKDHLRADLEVLRQSVLEKLGKNVTSDEVVHHFAMLPDRYLRVASEDDVVFHIGAVRQFMAEQLSLKSNPLKPVLRWRHFPERRFSELLVVTWDREMLFGKIAGSLSLAELDILSADIFTRGDNVVMDIFRVRTERNEAVIDSRDHMTVEENLAAALTDENFDFEARAGKLFSRRLKRLATTEGFSTRITWTEQASKDIWLLEIRTPDRPALLRDIAFALSGSGANIVHARIETDKGAAVDSFYLRLPEKAPHAETIKKINSAIIEVTDGWWSRFMTYKF